MTGRLLAGILVGLSAPAHAAAAQGPPATDIYLAPLTDGGTALGTPVNLTRRVGYDNQPHFLPDGSALYYTSYRDGQADVYRYDFATGTITQLTDTPESEYSPTPMPLGNRISVVRVEPDSGQRLWSFAADGTDARVLIPSVAPVGYHAWLADDIVAMFVLGDPVTLQVFHGKGGAPMTVAENIGRTLARVPGSNMLSFVQRKAEGANWITTEDMASEKHRVIATPRNDFFAWTPDGSLLTADDSKILRFRPGHDTAWVEIADLAAAGISGITRIAVSASGDRIAFVADDPSDR